MKWLRPQWPGDKGPSVVRERGVYAAHANPGGTAAIRSYRDLDVEAILYRAQRSHFFTQEQPIERLVLVSDAGRMLTMLIRSISRDMPQRRPGAESR